MASTHHFSVISKRPIRPSTATGIAALLCISCFVCLWRLGSVPLFDLDEGLYVSCARQMVITGDIVTPKLNSRPPADLTQTTSPFFEKPIFVYWAAAASMAAFGVSEWAARLPAALATLLIVYVVYRLGHTWYNRRAALIAALSLVTAPMMVIDARQMTTDALLALWFVAAMAAYRMCETERANDAESQPSRPLVGCLLFWTSCGLCVLTKGVVGLLLPLLVIVVDAGMEHGKLHGLLQSICTAVLKTRPLVGLPLFLVIAVPWHIAVFRAGGHDANGRTWFQEYVLRQHFGRFKGLDKVHNAPMPTYILYFLVGFFPWACFAPATMLKGAAGRATGGTDARNRRFLLAWFWTVFLFFTAGAAKLPTYIVPAYPSAALLFGRWADRALACTEDAAITRALRQGAVAAVGIASILLVAAIAAPRLNAGHASIPTPLLALARSVAGALFVGTFIGALLLCSGFDPILRSSGIWNFRLFTNEGVRVVGLLCMALTMVALVAMGAGSGYSLAGALILNPYQELAREADAGANAGDGIIYYNIVPRRPSMLYYAAYSPVEARYPAQPPLPPLLPLVETLTGARARSVELVTSRDALSSIVLPALTANHAFSVTTVRVTGDTHGGWALTRITRVPHR